MFTHCIEEKDRQLTSIMIVNARASKPRAQAGAEGEEVSTRLPHNLFLTNILSIVIISMLLLNQVESVESAIEPDRKEIKRRRPHEKTFRKVTKMHRSANCHNSRFAFTQQGAEVLARGRGERGDGGFEQQRWRPC